MLVIPVIDIKDGKVVRILEGLKNQTEYYCESPVNVAKLFRKENFKTLHITDLDGAINGEMKNFPLIAGIIKSLDIPSRHYQIIGYTYSGRRWSTQF